MHVVSDAHHPGLGLLEGDHREGIAASLEPLDTDLGLPRDELPSLEEEPAELGRLPDQRSTLRLDAM
jgi:hypothetical protein